MKTGNTDCESRNEGEICRQRLPLRAAGLLRLQRLLRATTGRDDDVSSSVVSVRRLEDDRGLADDFRATLKD